MRLHVTIAGKEHVVELRAEDGSGRAVAVVDGREVRLEALGPGGPPASWGNAEVAATDGAARVTVVALPGGAAGAGNPRSRLRLACGRHVVAAEVQSERDRLRSVAKPAARRAERLVVASTLPGVIRRVLCRQGAEVEEGQALLTLEAMKMENEVRAELKGRVRALLVREGQVVNAGDLLVEIEARAP
ncbi:MAG: biotin/lipoyl-binding protein [Planctomycetes bacterium]|nr:biotin/lipoyl-binding protein [Planctomycetota bacterium]